MKTEELPYQIIEGRGMRDVSTHVKVKGGEMKKQVSMCYLSLHTCGAQICTCIHHAHDFQAVNFSLSEHARARHAANIS